MVLALLYNETYLPSKGLSTCGAFDSLVLFEGKDYYAKVCCSGSKYY